MAASKDMNISLIQGTSIDDTLTGTGRSEVISGAGGNDIIFALSGNDETFGGTGDDILYGQAGNDVMYGNGKPAYVDMNAFAVNETTTATVTFIDEGAGFRNALGVYEIGDNGALQNVQILFANASKAGSGGSLVPGESQAVFDVSEGAKLGFFVVSNGYGKGSDNRTALESNTGHFEFRNDAGAIGTINDTSVELWHVDPQAGSEFLVRSQYGTAIFHSVSDPAKAHAPNPDGFGHVVGRASTVTGEVMIGFEDLWGGGDKDFDDTVITVELGQSNVAAMLPQREGTSGSKPDNDILYGGDGNDELYGVSGDDRLEGGRGNDELHGNSGNDSLWGNDGNDKMWGNSGDDTLAGGNGVDSMFGGSGADILDGGGGNDELQGGSGDDRLAGGSGRDELHGNSGDDLLEGGSGNDKLSGNSGDDRLIGGSGNDELQGHSGADHLSGGSGQDRLVGGSGDDFVEGGDHNDRVYGGSGADALYGGAGNDYLTGGSGNDLIDGGAGNDKLRGGSGSDTFVFHKDDQTGGRDTIYDFAPDDLIMLDGWEFETIDHLLDVATESAGNVAFQLDDDYQLVVRDYSLEGLGENEFLFA